MASLFETIFHVAPDVSHVSPGRVNLIGEHTDYNGGYVLPTALPVGVSMDVSLRGDNQIHMISEGFDKAVVTDFEHTVRDHWSDYVAGSAIYARQAGLLKTGVNIALSNTLPAGAGLSSSAALIVGLLKTFRYISQHNIGDVEIAKLARRVENDFIGVPCGIMDQMAVSISNVGEALALDTHTLAHEAVKIPSSMSMLVVHSGQYRQLNEGRYKLRKEDCDKIKSHVGREDICRMQDTEMSILSELSETLQRRARHVISEHRRTLDAIQCLKASDVKQFGRLMNDSHVSMRDDFEISTPEIDNLVADAQSYGAFGARMTGGGFGGCVVVCVAPDKAQAFLDKILNAHEKVFYVC